MDVNPWSESETGTLGGGGLRAKREDPFGWENERWFGGRVAARSFLYYFALGTGLVHLTSALSQTILARTRVNMDFCLESDYIDGSQFPDIVSKIENVVCVNIGYKISFFSWWSALAQMIFVVRYDRYWKSIVRTGSLTLFYYEYAISASSMMTDLAQLSGARNLWVHVLLFAHGFIMNLTGVIMELMRRERVQLFLGGKIEKPLLWTTPIKAVFFLGWVPFLGGFAAILAYFLVATQDSNASPPAFVYVAVLVIPVLFSIFPIICYKDYTGKWSKPKVVAHFILASLLAKTFLSWDVFGGALARD